MMPMETSTQNQSQQSVRYDENIFNEHVCPIIDSTNSSSNDNMNQLTSIVDDFFPKQVSLYRQQHISSASIFCGKITDGPSILHSSVRSFTSRHYPYQPRLFALPATIIDANQHLRSSSLLLLTDTTIDDPFRFTDRLLTTHIPSTALVGSYDRIAGNINQIEPIVPHISTDIMDQVSLTTRLFSRNTSMAKAITTTFCYISASDSVFRNNLTKKD